MILADSIPPPSAALWLSWNLDPLLVLGLALFTGAYFYALGPLRVRYGWADTINRGQVACFVAGTVVFALALISPLDAISDDYLFSAHMVQHMLIAVVAPPLWLLGTPEWMLAPLFKRRWVTRGMRWLTYPIVAFALFNGDLWLWHVPLLYDATLSNGQIHIFEHLTFTVTAIFFWWAVLSPVRAVPRMSYGAGMLYLFIACQPMVALGALLTFAAQPLYQPYMLAPRIWGISALTDQQTGGLIMWLPTNIPYLAVLSVMFFKFVDDHDRAERVAAGEFGDIDDLTRLPESAPVGIDPAVAGVAENPAE